MIILLADIIMMPINKPNHPNLTAPIPKFSILSVISPPEAMEYKNAPTKTIPNAGASKNTPKSDTDNIVPITNPIIQNIPINKLKIYQPSQIKFN